MNQIEGTSALATQVLTPDQEQQLALQSAMEVLTIAKAVHVETAEDYRAADDACAAIKSALKRADAKRDEFVRPLNTVVKKINAGFKDVENAYNSALAAYRGPMTRFQTKLTEARRVAEEAARKEKEEKEAQAREELRKAEEAAAQAQRDAEAAQKTTPDEDPFEAALRQQELGDQQTVAQANVEAAKQEVREAITTIIPDFVPKVTGGGSKTFTIWDFEVIDADLIPMKYRPIDFKMIEKDVRELKDKCVIPGIEVSSHVEVK
jgi:hypothetical protein